MRKKCLEFEKKKIVYWVNYFKGFSEIVVILRNNRDAVELKKKYSLNIDFSFIYFSDSAWSLFLK